MSKCYCIHITHIGTNIRKYSMYIVLLCITLQKKNICSRQNTPNIFIKHFLFQFLCWIRISNSINCNCNGLQMRPILQSMGVLLREMRFDCVESSKHRAPRFAMFCAQKRHERRLAPWKANETLTSASFGGRCRYWKTNHISIIYIKIGTKNI